MRILGIETSCDETGLALVEASGGLKSPKFRILKNLVASQVKIHAPFGGVVPNLAKREHLKNLPILFKKIGGGRAADRVDLIAVTVGPGLEPALWTGITFAKQTYNLGRKTNDKLKLIGVNHLEGHLYSVLLPKKSHRLSVISHKSKIFPAVALIVSGGHTVLLLMKDLKTWRRLGETRDDAVGEAFDKVARLLKLPYPGGPALEKLAKKGNAAAIDFPRPMIHDKNFDFSFSGLKTSVLYFLRDYKAGKFPSLALSPTSAANSPFGAALKGREAPAQKAGGLRGHPIRSRSEDFPAKVFLADVAASFQAAAAEVLVKKTMRAAQATLNPDGDKQSMLFGAESAASALSSITFSASMRHSRSFWIEIRISAPSRLLNTP